MRRLFTIDVTDYDDDFKVFGRASARALIRNENYRGEK